MESRTYVYQGDYGDRATEALFIKDVLRNFDKDTVTGCGIFVNNHIYNLQLLIFFTLESRFDDFEVFVRRSYSGFVRSSNIFTKTMLDNMSKRAGNMATFTDEASVNLIMTPSGGGTFIWPSKDTVNQKWSYFITPREVNAFLCHKTANKAIGRRIKDTLNSFDLSVWFDETEIIGGMSIVDAINSGLARSKGCIPLISQEFCSDMSRWTTMELNYFVTQIGGGEDSYIIPLLVEVDPKQLPALLRDTRAIIYGEEGWEEKLVRSVKYFLSNRN